MNGAAAVIVIVAAVSLLIVVAAPGIARFAVCRCARRLPIPFSLRMEEEWLAELAAIPSRPGKLGFGLALLLTRRKAFVNPGEEAAAILDRPALLASKKTLILLPTVVFALAAFGLSFLLPDQYASEALLLVRPQVVPENLVRGVRTGETVDDRMEYYSQVVLSRRNMVSLSREFHSERYDHLDMDQRVLDLREHIEIVREVFKSRAASFEIRFTGSDPITVQRITQKLTDLVLQSDLESRRAMIDGTVRFLSNELDKAETELKEFERQKRKSGEFGEEINRLKYEMLQSTYRSVFSKLSEAQMTLSLETMQRGDQILVLDPANSAHRVGPNRPAIGGAGALVGIALGGTAVFGVRRRQRRVLASN